jgi:predicted DNA-binding transcriptional regulator AlpA
MNVATRNRRKPLPVVAIEPLKLNIAGVCAITGLSESAIRRAVKSGGFPAPDHILGCTLWNVADVRQWAGQR